MFHRPISYIILGVALVNMAAAQDQGRFASLDRDGDGRISRDEFPGGAALFSRMDSNGDGFLDAGEVKAFQEKRYQRPTGEERVAALPGDIEIRGDIVYKKVDGQDLALDLYRLTGKTYEKAPLAVFIHGGGYTGGDKQGAVVRHPDIFLPLLREHGYQVASLNYRLCTREGAKLIDCSTDCMDALRFLARNREAYGIDTDRIATMGTSAGGSLALLLSLARKDDLPGDLDLASYPCSARCAVSWFGCTDFSRPRLLDEFKQQKAQGKFSVLFKSQPQADPHDCEIVSPVWYMRRCPDKVPILLVHGDSDTTVPPHQSAWMHEEAQRIGFPVEWVEVKNAGHGFQDTGQGPLVPSRQEINQRTLEFILKNNR